MLIAIDWGTTSFRAYLFNEAGTLQDKVSAAAGIMQVEEGTFEEVFYTRVGPWITQYPGVPVIASGMITSKQGWVETPYLPCPASIDSLASSLTRHETSKGDSLFFVSGVSQDGPVANIMRGEETEVAGLDTAGKAIVILPGTHSKWIRLEDGTILEFSTYMTGEVFAALTGHTILGRLMTDKEDGEAFVDGVRSGFQPPDNCGGLLSMLFGARAMPMLGHMKPDSIRDYLSGLLLGTEIREASNGGYDLTHKPLLCGSDNLVKRYETAFSACGIPTEKGPENLAGQGLLQIASAAGLLG